MTSQQAELMEAEPLVAGADAEAVVAAPVVVEKAKVKLPEVRYLGFRTTEAGREYSLRVTGEPVPRLFFVLISHDLFATGGARFQDGPGLCFTRLQRDLAEDPDLLSGSQLTLTAREVVALRHAGETRSPGRRAAR